MIQGRRIHDAPFEQFRPGEFIRCLLRQFGDLSAVLHVWSPLNIARLLEGQGHGAQKLRRYHQHHQKHHAANAQPAFAVNHHQSRIEGQEHHADIEELIAVIHRIDQQPRHDQIPSQTAGENRPDHAHPELRKAGHSPAAHGAQHEGHREGPAEGNRADQPV